jgi:hypothetical protein
MSELRDSEDEDYHKGIAAKLLTFKAFRFVSSPSCPRRVPRCVLVFLRALT